MPEITYEVLKKPIEERLIDAACLYWDVDRDFFRKDKKDTDYTGMVRKKYILFYLLKTNTAYSDQEISDKFGFLSRCSIRRGVETVEAQKDIYRQTLNDIEAIKNIANNLDASFVVVNVNLVNNIVLKNS